MRFFPRSFAVFVGVVCLGLCTSATAASAGDEWRPVDPAALASKASVVEKDADAEAIFWEIRIADEVDGSNPHTVMRHYIRIKIYTERGRESQSRIDIPYLKNWSIKDIAARTIKPDGSIIELKKEDVFERTILKSSGLKIKAKSFAMPGVEPGAIIEYRWREVHNDRFAHYLRLQFQREIPVQSIKYYIKPFSDPDFPYGMRARPFQFQMSGFQKEKDGFSSVSTSNVPAFHEEPRMPPEDSVRPWMLIYYAPDRKVTSEQFWKDYGKEVYDGTKSRTKVSDEVKQAAAQAIGDATGPEDKLDRLFEFCRSKIKNVSNESSGMTTEARANLKDNKSPADTLKRGAGTGGDIDMLFAALATAAGFETRIVRLADRSDVFLDKTFPDDYFLQTYDIAVRVGDKWSFYDPASTYVPKGMLRWQEEGEEGLVADPKESSWVTTPLSAPEKSKQKRVAKLRLSEDGALEGDVRIEYYGHLSVDQKNFNEDDSPTEREQTLRDSIKERMSTAELSEIKIENVTDPVKPFVYQYHIRVSGYAQRTGKRIFLQPSFFEHGKGPLFAASERKHAVYFHYPWSEDDEVSIDLPAGYTLDNAESATPFASPPISEYKPATSVTSDGKTLIFKRSFYFGGGGNILFPVDGYGGLKNFFDMLHKQDNHTITLKLSSTASN